MNKLILQINLLTLIPSILLQTIASGYNQSCALYYPDQLICWGSNNFGEAELPSIKPDMIIFQLSIGRNYICILYKETSSVTRNLECYGDDSYGKSIVPSNYSRAISIVETGDYHTCVKRFTKVMCWGNNDHGQLDFKFDRDEIEFFKVKQYTTCLIVHLIVKCFGEMKKNIDFNNDMKYGLSLGYTQVCWFSTSLSCLSKNQHLVDSPKISNLLYLTSYSYHSCAIYQENSKLKSKCWGSNTFGQLEVDYGLENSSITTGNNHTCTSTGYGYFKCIGDNSINQIDIPYSVRNQITYISINGLLSCATIGGKVSCFGKNYIGVSKIPLKTKYGPLRISVGYNHICSVMWNSLTIQSELYCWGFDKDKKYLSPDKTKETYYRSRAISTGYDFTCAIVDLDIDEEQTKVICWGTNTNGILNLPFRTKYLNYTNIKAGLHHVCGVSYSKRVACWGDNGKGQAKVPSESVDDSEDLAVGYYHSCSLNIFNIPTCWGLNIYGQTDLRDFGYDILRIYAGGYVTCIMDGMYNTYCIGLNTYKQLGSTQGWYGKDVTQLEIGETHACLLRLNGKMKCWGDNQWGQCEVPLEGNTE